MRSLLVAVLFGVGSANAQVYPALPLSPRPLPPGVSFPDVRQTDVVYGQNFASPPCPMPPTSFGHVWHFNDDPAVGKTQTGWGGLSMDPTVSPHQGDAAHPWLDLSALLGTISGSRIPWPGYSQNLLATAPAAVFTTSGPIQPGDEILVATGTTTYTPVISPDNAGLVNSPAVVIAPETGQHPVISQVKLLQASGFVFDGTGGTLQFRSTNSDGNAVIDINSGSTGSNFVFNHVDVSSADVTTADGWRNDNTAPTWITLARRSGIKIYNGNCVSVVNSHVYVTGLQNEAAVQVKGDNFLFRNNEIDHFYTNGLNFGGSGIAVHDNYFHDFVQANQFDSNAQLHAITDISDSLHYYDVLGAPDAPSSNVSIARNKSIESTDAGMLFPPFTGSGLYVGGRAIITNLVFYDNLLANVVSGDGALIGNTHNGIVANNSFMSPGYDTKLQVDCAHGGDQGPAGTCSSNLAIFNNIAPVIYASGVDVQFYNNVATASNGVYSWIIAYGQYSAAIHRGGSVQTLEAAFGNGADFVPSFAAPVTPQWAGHNNMVDGSSTSQTSEFAQVPAIGVRPMNPQPDWTPKSGSLAKTMGGVTLTPPITDYNRATFAPPYSIGALN